MWVLFDINEAADEKKVKETTTSKKSVKDAEETKKKETKSSDPVQKNSKDETDTSKIVSQPDTSTPAPSQPQIPAQAQPTYVNGVLLVNKNHAVPRSFGGPDATASAALTQLQAGANAAGYAMPLISGYRSYDYQATLYNNYVAIDGQEAADRYSARPGTSEHQTGLAFDIGQLDDNFGNTPAGQWLAQHAHEYGFIIRYPQGKEHITGYMYEPWHVRYLGVDLATSVYNSHLTLEEYLGVY